MLQIKRCITLDDQDRSQFELLNDLRREKNFGQTKVHRSDVRYYFREVPLEARASFPATHREPQEIRHI